MASMTYTQKLISGLWLLTGYRPLEGDVVNYLTGTDYETLERWAMANGPTWAGEGQVLAAAKVLAADTKDVTQTSEAPAAPVAPDWCHLKKYGYAPGNYMNRCRQCNVVVSDVDKRAITCRPCAEKLHAEATTPAAPVVPVEALARVRKSLTDRRFRDAPEVEELLRMAANVIAEDGLVIEHLKAKIAASATPGAQANQVKALENIRDDCMPDDLTPGEYACAVLNGYYAAPSPAPAPQSVSEPHLTAYMRASMEACERMGVCPPTTNALAAIIRAVLALGPAAPRAPLTIPDLPRGWKVNSVEPDPSMTDEANAQCRWMVQRVEAPYCTETGESSWHGATLHEAMLKAHEAMGLPFGIGPDGVSLPL